MKLTRQNLGNQVKSVLTKTLPYPVMVTRGVRLLLLAPNSYLHKSGWVSSTMAGRPVDAQGEPMPWMNTYIIDFLKERLHAEIRTFEWGSGFSTKFWAKRTKQVTSIEYDRQWFEQVTKDAPKNVSVVFVPSDNDGAYCRAMEAHQGKFDFVVVDGDDRVNCCKQAIGRLSKEGVLLLDDSQRREYDEAHQFMEDHGFKALTFEGIKPCDVGTHSTTIFYKNPNCLGL